MLATFDEVDLERELSSQSTGNQRLWLRTSRLPKPLRSWLATWLTIGAWKVPYGCRVVFDKLHTHPLQNSPFEEAFNLTEGHLACRTSSRRLPICTLMGSINSKNRQTDRRVSRSTSESAGQFCFELHPNSLRITSVASACCKDKLA